MTKPAVTFPDVELLVVDYLDANLAAPTSGVTIGRKLPPGWTTAGPDHLQILSDGTPTLNHPVTASTTIRLLAWSSSPTDAKALTRIAQGVLCAHPGGDGVVNVRALTGEQPGFDPEHQAALAASTCRVTVRSIPIS